ncbi:MAG: hypothetical protein IPF82_07180 [Blastocatellia bacterium]|nr:hypothetical protein [Blastocatellia bacterium]
MSKRPKKAQTGTVAPRAVKVKRGVKNQAPAAEPVPINRDQPTLRKVDRTRKVERTARPVVTQPKAPKNAVRVPNNNGPVVVQRAEKPIKVRKPSSAPLSDDSVVVRKPGRVNPTVRPSDDSVVVRKPARVNPNTRPSDAVYPGRNQTVNRAARVSDQIQRSRIAENKARVSTYNNYLIRQTRIADQRRRELQLQRRLAQARYMEDYWRRLAQQQQRVNSWQSYNYNNDPYFYTPANYRYRVRRQLLRNEPVRCEPPSAGHQRGLPGGYDAGRADRNDSWRYGYQDSFAFQDANYGYNGMYVSQSSYNYYFRQGFQRGMRTATTAGTSTAVTWAAPLPFSAR